MAETIHLTSADRTVLNREGLNWCLQRVFCKEGREYSGFISEDGGYLSELPYTQTPACPLNQDAGDSG